MEFHNYYTTNRTFYLVEFHDIDKKNGLCYNEEITEFHDFSEGLWLFLLSDTANYPGRPNCIKSCGKSSIVFCQERKAFFSFAEDMEISIDCVLLFVARLNLIILKERWFLFRLMAPNLF